MQLPETWQFLGSWWWILHIVAIGVVFLIGFLIGKASAEGGDGGASRQEGDGWQGKRPPEAPARDGED